MPYIIPRKRSILKPRRKMLRICATPPPAPPPPASSSSSSPLPTGIHKTQDTCRHRQTWNLKRYIGRRQQSMMGPDAGSAGMCRLLDTVVPSALRLQNPGFPKLNRTDVISQVGTTHRARITGHGHRTYTSGQAQCHPALACEDSGPFKPKRLEGYVPPMLDNVIYSHFIL